MRIAIASDVAGDQAKDRLVARLVANGHDVGDATPPGQAGDRSDYADRVALAVLTHDAERGIIISSRAVAASVSANGMPGIRAAICGDAYSAHSGAKDEGMNVLVLTLHSLQEELAAEILDAYLSVPLAPVEVIRGLSPRSLQRVFCHINEHIGQELRVVELSQLVGITQYYFSKLFKMSTGTTPHQYVMRRRIERAQELLRGTTAVLAEIAEEVGFATQSHFTSVFHRLTGLTPKEYRNARRAVSPEVTELQEHDGAAAKQKGATAA